MGNMIGRWIVASLALTVVGGFVGADEGIVARCRYIVGIIDGATVGSNVETTDGFIVDYYRRRLSGCDRGYQSRGL